MWNKIGLLLGMILILGLGCDKSHKLETITLGIAGENFKVELARPDEEQARGLMFRKKMGPREGMLFVYHEYVKHAFWMKNTELPLSIAFIADNGKILEIQNMTPFSERSVSPTYSYMFALEVNKGVFPEIGAAEGDFITFPAGFLP